MSIKPTDFDEKEKFKEDIQLIFISTFIIFSLVYWGPQKIGEVIDDCVYNIREYWMDGYVYCDSFNF